MYNNKALSILCCLSFGALSARPASDTIPLHEYKFSQDIAEGLAKEEVWEIEIE